MSGEVVTGFISKRNLGCKNFFTVAFKFWKKIATKFVRKFYVLFGFLQTAKTVICNSILKHLAEFCALSMIACLIADNLFC
jgi:hypothetical protein